MRIWNNIALVLAMLFLLLIAGCKQNVYVYEPVVDDIAPDYYHALPFLPQSEDDLRYKKEYGELLDSSYTARMILEDAYKAVECYKSIRRNVRNDGELIYIADSIISADDKKKGIYNIYEKYNPSSSAWQNDDDGISSIESRLNYQCKVVVFSAEDAVSAGRLAIQAREDNQKNIGAYNPDELNEETQKALDELDEKIVQLMSYFEWDIAS